MGKVCNERGQLDLHGMTGAVSNALLDITMCDFTDGERFIRDLHVITGQGHHSGIDGPVLIESTRAFLREQFDPPFEIDEVRGNTGMFVVRAAAIERWVEGVTGVVWW